MMNTEGSTKIVTFMTPGAGVFMLGSGHTNHIVKIHISLTFFFSTLVDQTNYVYGNDEHGRVYQNCNFHDPHGRVSCARVWPYKSYSENALYL